VELGSFLGRSTRFLAEHAPEAVVIAVDHWCGTAGMKQDAELAELIPRLYDSFLAECWPWRERIIPLRADTLQGLRKIAAAGLVPDVVFIDADHAYDAVAADLATALDLFPGTRIVGDDWNWPDVARAVRDVTSARGMSFEVHGVGWRILPDSRAPHGRLATPPHAEGWPSPR
jgi:predicted O-methyltransferase YrrM